MMKLKPKIVINIQKEINPTFKSVWTTNKPYNILKGGRNSFKSSVIALKLVYMMIKYIKKGDTANVVIIRKVANTLKDSVYSQLEWGMDNLSETFPFINENWVKTKSPLVSIFFSMLL